MCLLPGVRRSGPDVQQSDGAEAEARICHQPDIFTREPLAGGGGGVCALTPFLSPSSFRLFPSDSHSGVSPSFSSTLHTCKQFFPDDFCTTCCTKKKKRGAWSRPEVTSLLEIISCSLRKIRRMGTKREAVIELEAATQKKNKKLRFVVLLALRKLVCLLPGVDIRVTQERLFVSHSRSCGPIRVGGKCWL